MTRNEFMERARREIDQAFAGQKDRMMDLVQQAWAEGKRAAETDAVVQVIDDVMEIYKAREEARQVDVRPWLDDGR